MNKNTHMTATDFLIKHHKQQDFLMATANRIDRVVTHLSCPTNWREDAIEDLTFLRNVLLLANADYTLQEKSQTT